MSALQYQGEKEEKANPYSKVVSATGEEIRLLARGTGGLVMLEVIVGMLLVTIGVPVPGLGFPLALLVLMVLCLKRLSSPSSFTVPPAGLFAGVMVIGLLYVSIASLTVGVSTFDDVFRRVSRICILLLALFLIADRRIHFKSLILGLAIGLVGNAIAFYAGIAPDTYGGALTGWLSDKNVSGLYYGIVPIFLFGMFPRMIHRVLALIIFLPLLWETGSRTSMAALILGVMWIMLAQKAKVPIKIGLAALCAWFFEWLQTNFADSAIFGDRTGTDLLRSRIDEASLEKVQSAPWSGWGLGQAVVPVGEGQFFFHNSYWTLLVEGGWIWLTLVAGLTLLSVLFWKQYRQEDFGRILTAEAATVYLAVCSWRLGEVMLTLPWVFAVGLALSLTARPTNLIGSKSKSLDA